MVSSDWLGIFPDARLFNYAALISDHSPILLSLVEKKPANFIRRFKFENSWLRESDLDTIMFDKWSKIEVGDLVSKLEACVEDLSHQDKNLRSQFKKDINRCKQKLDVLWSLHDSDSVNEYNVMREKLLGL